MKQTILLLLLAASAFARTPVSGWCEQGNQVVVTVGVANSTTKVQRSYPSCTVRVVIYGAGAATLYSDNSGTPLSNPFTANSNGSWSFFADANIYTVTLSGAGIAAPFSQNLYVSNEGTGITNLNGLTAATQVFTVGTAGTDFAISSVTATHTFNLPTASATNRGALSSADWITFNAKQSALSFTAPLVNTAGTVALTVPLSIPNGGTGQATQTAGFNSLSPLTTKGDIIVHNGTNNIRFGVCPNTQAIIGDSAQASGLNCGAVPTSSGLTTNQILKAGSSSSIVNSAISDNGTVVTSTEQIKAPSLSLGATPPALTAGTGTAIAALEGTAPATCAAAGVDCLYPDSTAHALKVSYNNGTAYRIPQVIASGTSTMGTTLINSAACATAVTTAATGAAATDTINWTFNADPTGVTGYAAAAGGVLTVYAYPTANNVNFKICNATAGGITPGSAVTFNWNVVR